MLSGSEPRRPDPDRPQAQSPKPEAQPRSSEQRCAVLAKPPLGVAKLRARLLDQAPKADGMVRLAQVHQLVDEDVVADVRGHQHEAEVERDVPLRRAGAPPRALVADRDA